MKKYIAIISLILGVNCWAQTGNINDFQKEDFLSQFGEYFENAEVTETGTIRLQAKESFTTLSAEKKHTIMELVLSKGYTMASIAYEYKRELWQKDTSGIVVLLDSWDLNMLYTPKVALKTLKKTDTHPFFYYLGLSGTFSENQTNLFYSANVGFFLLKNRWNLALSNSSGTFGNGESSSTNNELGIMSKVYFPIQKYNIAPYAGLGISYSITRDESNNVLNSSWNIPLYLGVSWFVGPGSLDFGLQISNNTVFMVGYTFSPDKLSKKK